MPERGRRIGARSIDLIIDCLFLVPTFTLVDGGTRPFTFLAIWWMFVVTYQTLMVWAAGATLGKLAVGLRVAALDHVGRVPLTTALRRAAASAGLLIVPIIGWAVLLMSTLGDALTRGIPDRAADTMVVPKATQLPIRTRDLPGYADYVRQPRFSPYGRIGDLDVRVRARMRRLNGAPLLIVVVGILNLIASGPWTSGIVFAVGTAVWILFFVVDETRRVARTGATAGHELAGLVIYSPKTGGPPSTGRSFARALVFALSAYTGVGVIFLAISALMIRSSDGGRALHDFAGGTWVIADPRLDPEVQRQRTMRMRLGEVS